MTHHLSSLSTALLPFLLETPSSLSPMGNTEILCVEGVMVNGAGAHLLAASCEGVKQVGASQNFQVTSSMQ